MFCCYVLTEDIIFMWIFCLFIDVENVTCDLIWFPVISFFTSCFFLSLGNCSSCPCGRDYYCPCNGHFPTKVLHKHLAVLVRALHLEVAGNSYDHRICCSLRENMISRLFRFCRFPNLEGMVKSFVESIKLHLIHVEEVLIIWTWM